MKIPPRLSTKSEFVEFLSSIWASIADKIEPDQDHPRVYQRGASHNEKRAKAELLLRSLWAPICLPSEMLCDEQLEAYRSRIISGTNPENPDYWGPLEAKDQLAVEMPVLALSLALSKEKIWADLSEKDFRNICSWLLQINEIEIPNNNWKLFPLIVNISLRALGEKYCRETIINCCNSIDSYYIGNGWYKDGQSGRVDYYCAFSIHFYLIVARRICPEIENWISVADRARLFATQYAALFSSQGEAVPFGRSLCYRFAHASIWGALAFAGLETIPWERAASLYRKNIQFWAAQEMFSDNGILNVGYAYPNDLVAEYYISSGSPYWALSSFVGLLAPAHSPFWCSGYKSAVMAAPTRSLEIPGMVVSNDPAEGGVIALNAGRGCEREFGAVAEKYSKFAYATDFGFNCSRGNSSLEVSAADSSLAFKLNDGAWFTRTKSITWHIDGPLVYASWAPFEGVEVETFLVDLFPWHLRVHRIRSLFSVGIAEGGFAAPGESISGAQKSSTDLCNELNIDGSGISNVYGERYASVVRCFPNTNIKHKTTVLPMLLGQLGAGESVLACLVLGRLGATSESKLWREKPNLKQWEHLWSIQPETPF